MSDGEPGAGDKPDSSGTDTDSGREETPTDTVADVSRDEATRDPNDPVPGRKIRRLHEVATAMQTATSVEEIYNLTVDTAVDILGFDWCAVEIAVEGHFEIAAVSEEAPLDVGARPITTEHGVTGDAYMAGESHVIRDTNANPDADPTLEEFRSGLTVPLGDRGVFQGISSETEFFDEDDLELAELLIANTTAELDRVEETERLNELNRATRQLMTAETHEAVAREGCEIASSVLDTPLTIVYYHDGTENALVPMAATETAREVLDGPEGLEGLATVDSGDHPARTAMADEETVRRHNAGDESWDWEGLYVPMGEYGVLCVGSPVQGAFDESDVALAETLAATIEAAFARADREQRRREQAEQLQRQNERLERMETIIDDTLSLARKGKTVEETEPVSLRRIASQSWDQVETGGASLETVGDEVVQADPDRLRSVFENLFRNAVEHGSTSPASQARQDAVEHGVTGEPDDLGVRIGHLPGGFYVEDTGQGIPAGERKEVFDLGYSSDEDGTGFGLAIVKETVE